jgi:integrase/recombinase XerD
MPRTAILRPKLREARGAKGLAAWVVNVPPDLSPTGKRQELFFPTKSAASVECEKLKARKDNFGISLSSMTSAKVAEASEAYKLIDPLNIGLLDAVRAHIATVKARSASIPFGEVFDRFAESKQKKSQKYRDEIRQAKASFETLHNRMVCDITPSDLEPILDRFPDASRNAKMRRLRSVFNLATKRGWMGNSGSPITKIDFAAGKRKTVEVFPVPAVQKLLEHALNNDLEFLPYRVLTFFCGVRPEGEIERLEWSDVNIADKTVVLRPEITKTNRRRTVDLSANAIGWLTEYQVRGGKMTGLVAPWTPQVRRTKHRTSYKAVGIKKWIQQGARHSFCSYWLNKHENADKLVMLSGHTDKQTMWERYHAGVTKAEAEEFWSITPPADLANVVAFQKEA